MLNWLRNLAPCKRIDNKESKQPERPPIEVDKNVAQILECEKNSKEIIAKARERRKANKEKAVKEAEKLIEEFRKEREAKFQEHCAKVTKQTEEAKKVMGAEIDKKLRTTSERVAKNKDAVIKVLIERVTNIEPKIHPNARFLLQRKQDNESKKISVK